MLEMLFSWHALRMVLWCAYVPSCVGLIIIVLLQKGKGSGFAGAFGLGAGSDAVFGPRATRSLPARLTRIMASVFLVLAFAISIVDGRIASGNAPDKKIEVETPQSALSDIGLGSAYDKEEPAEGTVEGTVPVDSTDSVDVVPPSDQLTVDEEPSEPSADEAAAASTPDDAGETSN